MLLQFGKKNIYYLIKDARLQIFFELTRIHYS